MPEPRSEKPVAATNTDSFTYQLLDEVTRHAGLYQGPPIPTLPTLVQERVRQILEPTLEALTHSVPGYSFLNCRTKPLEYQRGESYCAEESLLYQYEVDVPSYYTGPLEYLYQDPEVMVVLEIKSRAPEKTTSDRTTLVQLSWPEELVNHFESNSYYEDAGTYLSYDLVRAIKQVRFPRLEP